MVDDDDDALMYGTAEQGSALRCCITGALAVAEVPAPGSP